MKSKLLLFIALNILLDFTSSISIFNEANIAEPHKVISNYFPEVTYPTSLFEVNEPFYYKTHSDNVLEAFPDDVRNAYISFRTSNIPSTKNAGKKLEDNLLIDIAKCCAAINNCTNNIGAKYDKLCENNDQNFTLDEMVEDNDEQNNNDENNADLFEAGQWIQSRNDTIAPNISDDQNYTGTPVQLIIENDVLDNDSDLFTSVPIKTLILADLLNLFNNSISEEDQGIITKSFIEEDKLSNINTFDELDEIDFQNILSELMCNYSNVSSEFMTLQPEIEEIFDPDSNEFTYSSIEEDSIHTINNESFSIPVDFHKINSPIVIINNETVSTEIARKFINNKDKDKVQNKGSDSFLELIISLNQQLQNDDFQNTHEYEKQTNSTQPSK